MSISFKLSALSVLLAVSGKSKAFSIGGPQGQQTCVNRGAFLKQGVSAGVALVLLTPQSSFAKESDPQLKGTKKDPKYESCVSACLFECTKPKVSLIHKALWLYDVEIVLIIKTFMKQSI